MKNVIYGYDVSLSTKANKPEIYRLDRLLADRTPLTDFLAFKSKIEGDLALQVSVF
jgi:hypothetical protein